MPSHLQDMAPQSLRPHPLLSTQSQPGTFPPQDLCICSFLCLESSSRYWHPSSLCLNVSFPARSPLILFTVAPLPHLPWLFSIWFFPRAPSSSHLKNMSLLILLPLHVPQYTRIEVSWRALSLCCSQLYPQYLERCFTFSRCSKILVIEFAHFFQKSCGHLSYVQFYIFKGHARLKQEKHL